MHARPESKVPIDGSLERGGNVFVSGKGVVVYPEASGGIRK